MITNLSDLKPHKLLSYNFIGGKYNASITVQKSRCYKGCAPFWRHLGEIHSLPLSSFYRLLTLLGSWTPYSIFKAKKNQVESFLSITLTSSSFKYPCDCVCVCVCVHTQSLSHVWLFATPWTVAHSPVFPRQEYGSGLPFPPPGDLPNPRIEPGCSALAGRFFTTVPSGKPSCDCTDPIQVIS